MAFAEPGIYQARRHARSEFLPIRKLRYHVRIWEPIVTASRNDADAAMSQLAPTLFLLHGWMDVSASFQFLVDCLAPHWRVIAPDWRGYGQTQWTGSDSYGFADYLADLEALLDHYSPQQAVNLVAHSMGGNVATFYAGIRPERVVKLINLEGIGLRGAGDEQAPDRYGRWLDQIKAGARLRDYDSAQAVAQRLMKTNPRLRSDYANYLARFWSAPNALGRYQILGDPAHKIVNANLYRVDEANACWQRIRASVVLVLSEHMGRWQDFINSPGYQSRLALIDKLQIERIASAGHMMHHDQPAAVAALIEKYC